MVNLEHNFNRRQNYVKQKASQKRILVIDDDLKSKRFQTLE